MLPIQYLNLHSQKHSFDTQVTQPSICLLPIWSSIAVCYDCKKEAIMLQICTSTNLPMGFTSAQAQPHATVNCWRFLCHLLETCSSCHKLTLLTLVILAGSEKQILLYLMMTSWVNPPIPTGPGLPSCGGNDWLTTSLQSPPSSIYQDRYTSNHLRGQAREAVLQLTNFLFHFWK